MEGYDKITEILNRLGTKGKFVKKGLDFGKDIFKKINPKTGRKILSLSNKSPSKTKQINKRTQNLKKKQSKSKALVTKGKQIFDKPIGPKKLNISDFMKKPINKQSKSLVVTKPKTGTSIVPKPNTKVVNQNKSTSIVPKPNTKIVKKNKSTALVPIKNKKIPTKDLKRKTILTGLNQIKKDGVKLGQDALGEDTVPKKKKITPQIKKPKTDKVKKEKLPKLAKPTKVQKKNRSNIVQSKNYDAQYTYDMLKKKGGKEFAKGRMSKENFAKVKKYSKGTQGKTIAGLKDLPSKSENPGIHMLPSKAKMNMGFKPMFGGGLVSSFYDKPEKAEKYKGNASVARQVKGFGKAKKKN